MQRKFCNSKPEQYRSDYETSKGYLQVSWRTCEDTSPTVGLNQLTWHDFANPYDHLAILNATFTSLWSNIPKTQPLSGNGQQRKLSLAKVPEPGITIWTDELVRKSIEVYLEYKTSDTNEPHVPSRTIIIFCNLSNKLQSIKLSNGCVRTFSKLFYELHKYILMCIYIDNIHGPSTDVEELSYPNFGA
jgi:hypothetical protein